MAVGLENKARTHIRFALLWSLLFFLFAQSSLERDLMGFASAQLDTIQYSGPDSFFMSPKEPYVIDLGLYFEGGSDTKFSVYSDPQVTLVLDGTRLIVSSPDYQGQVDLVITADSREGSIRKVIPLLIYPNLSPGEIVIHNMPGYVRLE